MQANILELLEGFIIRAKAATYVGSGAKSFSHRPASHDLESVGDGFQRSERIASYDPKDTLE